MDVHAQLDAPCSAERLFSWVDDLSTYPRWMRLAHRVDLEPADVAIRGATVDETSYVDGTSDVAAGPIWLVELRASVGPMSRSKRLRMIRSERSAPDRVVFARQEGDGRRHSPWILTAEVSTIESGSRLAVHLHYGGGLWTGGVMERALADEIERGRSTLVELVANPPD